MKRNGISILNTLCLSQYYTCEKMHLLSKVKYAAKKWAGTSLTDAKCVKILADILIEETKQIFI